MAISKRREKFTNVDSSSFVSDRTYWLTISAVLLFGFAVNAIEVLFMRNFFMQLNAGLFLISYIVGAIAGGIICAVSRNPVLSFVGYLLIVLPLGGLLSLFIPETGFTALRSSFLVTTLMTTIMCLLSILYPTFFRRTFGVLMLGLSVALIYQLIAMLFGFGTGIWYEWMVVLLFCGYIGFDVSYANSRPRTIACAIDSACCLYLDIINLLIRLAYIFSNRD